jgi:hypothetical protein
VRFLVTSAGSANGGGHDAVLAFNAEGEFVGPFSDDPRIADPRGLCIDPSGALIYLNSVDRMLALDRSGGVVRDSGPMADLDPGGAVFGPDGRFYVTTRRRRTILGISATLDGHAEPLAAGRQPADSRTARSEVPLCRRPPWVSHEAVSAGR